MDSISENLCLIPNQTVWEWDSVTSYHQLQPLVERVSPGWYSVPLKVQVRGLLVGTVVVGGTAVVGGMVVEVSAIPLGQEISLSLQNLVKFSVNFTELSELHICCYVNAVVVLQWNCKMRES